MKTRFLIGAVASAWLLRAAGAQLTESTITDIVKDVSVIPQATQAAAPATLHETVKAPDQVRTGMESRAELTAPDQTITRIGANTVFSFEPAGRTIDLKQGSILFHSPTGKGGGSIRSGGAAAAVLGTTIIVVAAPDGGFKVIVLEGKGHVRWPGGKSSTLAAGQLVFVLPGQAAPGRVLDINLGKLVAGSGLVNGFSHELPSLPRIRAAIDKQNHEIAKGRARDTGLPADIFRNNGLNTIDNNNYATFVLQIPPKSPMVGTSGPPGPPPFHP